MAARVQRLDPITAGRIAAGEVIERPASVVKELLDNALDAASTRIDIDIHNGGRRLIQVTDNGCGMDADEAELALQRFTTSKIRQLEDLAHLTTLGFRGEALPSMVAMADVDITTRPAHRAEGVLVQAGPDRATSVRPIGCPLGTCVRVHHLFAQTPVRRNALKSVAREVQQIHEIVARYALAYPQVTFQVQHDGRRLLFAPASPDFVQRLPVIFNRGLVAHLFPVQWQSVDLQVYGAVSAPTINRASRQRQYFWVNGRPIRSGLISMALARAYGAFLPPGRYPVAALGLRVPAPLLDINMHPRKTEITFVHERAIFAAVQEAVETVLQRCVTTEGVWAGETGQAGSSLWLATPGISDAGAPYDASPPPATQWQPLGQVGHTFIVASGVQGLLLLDQHAADETLLYAQLLAAEAASVELPEPLLLTLSAGRQGWLDLLQPALRTLRIQVEPFGKEAVLVRAAPAMLVDRLRPGNFLEALHEAIRRIPARATPEEVRDHLGAALACRTALRAGDRLSAEEVTALVQAVAQQRLAYTCPHGRPTYIMLSLADLERRFLRLFPLDTPSPDC